MKRVGIWIDSKKAVVVTLSGKSQQIQTIDSPIITRERIDGEGKAFGRFGDQYLNEEQKKEARQDIQARHFFHDLIDIVDNSDHFVVFGPSFMKTEFEKEINKHPEIESKLMSVETADSMTDNQIAAWVRDYFQAKLN